MEHFFQCFLLEFCSPCFIVNIFQNRWIMEELELLLVMKSLMDLTIKVNCNIHIETNFFFYFLIIFNFLPIFWAKVQNSEKLSLIFCKLIKNRNLVFFSFFFPFFPLFSVFPHFPFFYSFFFLLFLCLFSSIFLLSFATMCQKCQGSK